MNNIRKNIEKNNRSFSTRHEKLKRYEKFFYGINNDRFMILRILFFYKEQKLSIIKKKNGY
jgi:hypothetical protein